MEITKRLTLLAIASTLLSMESDALDSAIIDKRTHHSAQARVSKPQFRDLLEQALFTPADVQTVFSLLPSLYPTGTYLQIGANTMDNPNDPLAAHLDKYSAHRKVFVEPVPPLYNRLRKNLVAMPNTTFINAAVSNKTEGDVGEASEDVQKAEMFCLPTDENGEVHGTGLPQWANQICSFSKAHVLKLLPQAEIQKFEVDALTIRQMLQLHSISDVLVVLIDTEGFDWEVVKQLPLHHSGFQPVLIGFEHQHLSAADVAAAKELLHRHGYAVVQDPATLNTWALATP